MPTIAGTGTACNFVTQDFSGTAETVINLNGAIALQASNVLP